ncbi:NAD(P)/FAD-dependent oxidoreductase [Chryseolinea sp. T2]|uniref:NAD(P)/FAD-dependent oxidoreductase n=1 Tax=Chryseolinea sp. T2 TaxID=3129255 RepID=UPI0030769189
MQFDLIVIGGGAAGFFGAIQAAATRPGLRIAVLEKTQKLLTKVKVSGGGRCNVTHACHNPFELARHYPRGEKMLKQSFKEYHADDVVQWFKSRGIELKTEGDGRMFPVTDDSQTIIDCFLTEATRLNIDIQRGAAIISVVRGTVFTIASADGRSWQSKHLLIAIGGHNNTEPYNWIRALGHTVVPPIPSLFTFNDKERRFQDLMGIAVPAGEVKIASTKFAERGPILITHWGLSGPAVIKLSAWAATYLHEQRYVFDVRINWTGESDGKCRETFTEAKISRSKQKIHGHPMFSIPQRLWVRLCELSDIEVSRVWGEVSNRELNKLTEHLVNTVMHVSGKTTFKEEFVTCGGVELNEIDSTTLESKKVPGLYFAGEVLNIDGETGGFNFQAAWTTAYLAARSIADA